MFVEAGPNRLEQVRLQVEELAVVSHAGSSPLCFAAPIVRRSRHLWAALWTA
jgi:hypothetical protein